MNLHVRLGSYTLILDLIFKTKCDKNKIKGEFSTMKLKRIKFYHVFTLLITTIIGFIYGNEIIKSQATFSVRGGILNEYNLELNNTNKPFVQDDIIVNHEKYTSFQYSKAIIDGSSNHVILDKNGLITNITPITGLTRINIQFSTLDFDAKLFLYFGKNVLPIFNEIEIISGNDTEITIPSDYLVIQSQFGRISIESVNIIYACTQDELEHKVPKLYINTEKDSHGNHIIPTNKVDYINSQIYLVDEKNSENNMGTLSKPLEAGIRLRGNSTMNKPKKPYRIKFDKKQAPFGLPKNKNWVLLAEYMDASSLHNYSAYSFAQQLDGFDFAPSTNFVEVILNGNSQGLYLFSDHVQAKAGRVDIEHDEEVFALDKNFEDINILFELDQSALYDSTETIDVTYFKYNYSETKDFYYTLKYPKMENFPNQEMYFDFFDYFKDYIDYTWQLFKGSDTVALLEKIDSNSLVDFMMTDLFFNEGDHHWKSFKMYRVADTGKLHFGPVWDYDSTSFSLSYTGEPIDNPLDNIPSNPFGRTTSANLYFQLFRSNHGGNIYLSDRYNEVGAQVVEDIILKTETAYCEMSYLLITDTNSWYQGNLSMVFENIKYVFKYIENRHQFLSTYFS